MIRFVLTDLDDTIFDFAAAEREAARETFAALGVDTSARTLSRYSQLNDMMWKRLERGEVDRETVKRERFALLFSELGASADPVKARYVYEDKLCLQCPLIGGAEEFLAEAAKIAKLYLITNGTTRVQRSRLALSGTEKYFSGVFISEAVGFVKPDPRFFAAVAAAIPDFDPRKALVVGDSLTSDIAGGKAAGIRTCLFDPSGRHGEGKADYTVHRLMDILPILGAAENKSDIEGRH